VLCLVIDWFIVCVAVQASLTVRISCLQCIHCLCSHVTSLDQYLSATYLVDLYCQLIGHLRQRHSAVCSDSMTSMMQSSVRSVELFSNDIVMMEMTLAALMSVFDVDKFNSCLQELLDDVVCCN